MKLPKSEYVLLAAIGVVAYILWKRNQENSSFDAYNYASGGARNVAAGGCVSPKCKCYYKDGRPFTAGGQTMCAEHCCSGGI